MKKLNNLLKILTAQVMTIAIVLTLVEIAGQLYAYSNPGYEALSAIPDRTVGWRLAPNLEYVHTGGHWYANEFSVEIKHNSQGFRDDNRSTKKLPGTTRIALLGDSFVAAKEVAFKNTPGQILEGLLNNQNLSIKQNQNFEVLNFGIGGIGIGQSFLTYRQYAQTFDPDYVFLFIFVGDIWRTISPLSAITNNIVEPHQLKIRPFFSLYQGYQNIFQTLLGVLNFRLFHQILLDLKIQKLATGNISFPTEEEYLNLTNSLKSLITEEKITKVSENLNQSSLLLYTTEESDFDEFVRLQNERVESDMGEDRTKVREHKIFLLDLWGKIGVGLNMLNQKFSPELSMKEEFDNLIKTYGPRNSDVFSGSQDFPNFEITCFINLKVLETLNRDIINESRKFVIVDASSHLVKNGRLPANLLSTILEKYCKVNGIGYIPLYQPLNEAKRNGTKTTWPKDGHFNENGYRIFGEAMFQWIEAHKE